MAAMYQLLAQDCNDVLATFAYAFYKQHKAEVMDAIRAQTGRPVEQAEIDAFYLAASVPAMRAMYILRAEQALKNFLDETLVSRRRELEADFTTTKIGEQLQAIRTVQQRKRTWKGWAAEVSGNLAVNFVTILVIAALLFGFQGLDQALGEFGRNSGVLRK